METELVFTGGNDIYCDSMKIAEKLEVKHADLLRTINKIIKRKKQVAGERIVSSQKFIEAEFTNKQGRTYKKYNLNEPAFIKLVMQLKGYEKAEIVQDMFVEAFMNMKKIMIAHTNESWRLAREEWKAERLAETDKIKEFVEYATAQWATHAKYYYANITKMTYRGLELLNHEKPIRDMLSRFWLSFLWVAEDQVTIAIEEWMKEWLHYKEIFMIAKARVEKLAELLPNKEKLLLN